MRELSYPKGPNGPSTDKKLAGGDIIKHADFTAATPNITPDPEIDLDVVAGEPRYGEYQYAINNSFGFGGHNVALAFGRY